MESFAVHGCKAVGFHKTQLKPQTTCEFIKLCRRPPACPRPRGHDVPGARTLESRLGRAAGGPRSSSRGESGRAPPPAAAPWESGAPRQGAGRWGSSGGASEPPRGRGCPPAARSAFEGRGGCSCHGRRVAPAPARPRRRRRGPFKWRRGRAPKFAQVVERGWRPGGAACPARPWGSLPLRSPCSVPPPWTTSPPSPARAAASCAAPPAASGGPCPAASARSASRTAGVAGQRAPPSRLQVPAGKAPRGAAGGRNGARSGVSPGIGFGFLLPLSPLKGERAPGEARTCGTRRERGFLPSGSGPGLPPRPGLAALPSRGSETHGSPVPPGRGGRRGKRRRRDGVGGPAHGPGLPRRRACPAAGACQRAGSAPEGLHQKTGLKTAKPTSLWLHGLLASVAMLPHLLSLPNPHACPYLFSDRPKRGRQLEHELLGLISPLCTRWFLPLVCS